jgi:serine/threonine-protein kinase
VRSQAAIPGVPEEVRSALLPDLIVTRLLGRGGMGQVLLARELSLDREVAVKVLPLEESDDIQSVERFSREARVAAGLRHPNIVSIHSVGHRRRVTYFTMDFVAGHTLTQCVERDGPPIGREACRIMADVAGALAHAHERGVVHRDIKPPNIMLQANGHVYTMDFGLARQRGAATLTESGVVHGTPEYLSPEQAQGQPATAASDAYAFGLTLAYLLTGAHVVRAETVAATLLQHVHGDVADRAADNPRVPFRLRALIRSLLDRDPARRKANMAEVEAALRAAMSDDTLAVAQAAPPAAATQRAPGDDSSPQTPRTPRTPTGTTPGRARTRERLKGLLDKLDKTRDDDT